MSPKIKYTYFPVEGLGELARFCLAYWGVEWEDNRVNGEQWRGGLKEKSLFGTLPLLEFDGEVIGQSNAIARFIAKKAGVAGRNELEQAKADMMVDYYMDYFNKLRKMRFATSPEEQKKDVQDFFENWLPDFLKRSEAILQKNGGKYLAGDALTYADFAYTIILDFLIKPEEKAFANQDNQYDRFNLLKKYPGLDDLRKRIHEEPNIKKYVQQRPKTTL